MKTDELLSGLREVEEALKTAYSFIGELTTAGGSYHYINGTPLVSAAYSAERVTDKALTTLKRLQAEMEKVEAVVDAQLGEFAIREFHATMGFDAYRMAIACAEAWGLITANVRETPKTEIEDSEGNILWRKQ